MHTKHRVLAVGVALFLCAAGIASGLSKTKGVLTQAYFGTGATTLYCNVQAMLIIAPDAYGRFLVATQNWQLNGTSNSITNLTATSADIESTCVLYSSLPGVPPVMSWGELHLRKTTAGTWTAAIEVLDVTKTKTLQSVPTSSLSQGSVTILL